MLPIGKLLGLLALQRGISSDTTQFQNFLNDAGRFILLTVVTAFMVGALLVGGLLLIHHMLVSYGLTMDAANLVVAGFALIITLALMLTVNAQLQRLQHGLHRILRSYGSPLAPITSKLTDTAEAFLDGLTGSSKRSKSSQKRY